ncbi:MAG TPA: CsgG/HfaB family protein [Gemmatimonadales bacterium]|nr:CsgG/HfaB family protein [Gemmatimonadales bacterium]
MVLACGACATGGGGAIRVSDVTPQSIASLEAERSQRPHDANTLTRLGVAYFKAGRYKDARPVLDTAATGDPSSGVAAVYLGMTAEQLGDFAAARAAYQRYIGIATNPDLKRTAQQRLALVDRNELTYQAHQALANESSIAAMPPESNTVAVMPFLYSGRDSTIQPLGRGLAQLLVTDLAKSRQIRVLERERMQAILGELKLSDSAQADPSTALRSGHLLRAARVVQGAIAGLPGNQLQVDAAVVDVSSSGVAPTAQQRSTLARLFDLEKQLAYGLFNSMGIQLSPSEQSAIDQRPTQNLQAFLVYSRGLEAQDRGDYASAQADFNQATTLDPTFRAASQSAATATSLSAASQQSVSQVETAVSQSTTIPAPPPPAPTQDMLTAGTNSVAPTTTTTTAQSTSTSTTQPTTERSSQPEVTGTLGGQRATGTVVIIIQRPK